jgi:putative membrane protein
MMQGWGMQGWGMDGGFGWGGGFGGMVFMGLFAVLAIVGLVFVVRWALEQGGSARKPPAG